MLISFYRATARNATHGIAVAIMSVRPSDACIVTTLNDGLRIFWYHTIRQSLYLLTPTMVGGRCPLLS